MRMSRILYSPLLYSPTYTAAALGRYKDSFGITYWVLYAGTLPDSGSVPPTPTPTTAVMNTPTPVPPTPTPTKTPVPPTPVPTATPIPTPVPSDQVVHPNCWPEWPNDEESTYPVTWTCDPSYPL
jgi:hypothetical protein